MPTDDSTAIDLVSASRAIAACRKPEAVWALVLDTLGQLPGVDRAAVAFPGEAVSAPDGPSSILQRQVASGGRDFGVLYLILDAGTVTPGWQSQEAESAQATLDLVAMVAGTTLSSTRTAAGDDASTSPQQSVVGDRRRMDRDAIDHSRVGQVGYLVFELATNGGDDGVELGVAIDAMTDATRDGDVVYVAGPHQFGVLLPGASRADSSMVAERIHQAVVAAWGGDDGPLLFGGVTSGRYEDPQRLAERAFAALDEARDGLGPIVTDLAA